MNTDYISKPIIETILEIVSHNGRLSLQVLKEICVQARSSFCFVKNNYETKLL